MRRIYSITILPKNTGVNLPYILLTNFKVLITEPSAWIAEGATNAKGLSFLDVEGRLLEHLVFVHIPLFLRGRRQQDEANEIKILVASRLLKDYQISEDDFIVDVKEDQ